MQDIQKYPTVTSLQLHQADPSLEKDKKSIYNHPLYPLLSLLLEQCEQATSTPESSSSTTDTFEADLQSYIQRNENNDKLFLTENKDLDSLMVKAIQVLRIHLIELRKVNELCKDFCSRYINCLKTKIHSDSLFDDSEESSPNCSERMSPNIITGGSGSAYNSPYSSHAGSLSRGGFMDLSSVGSGGNHHHHHRSSSHIIGGNNGNTNGNDCVDFINGSHGTGPTSPLSELAVHDDINNNNTHHSSNYHHHHHHSHHHHHFNNILDPSKQKRGVLPKKATQIMKQWLFQHLVHPYPTEDEKRQIAGQTNLTLLQVNNWFINARRRILQPMLDSSNSPVGFPSKDKSCSKLDKSDANSENDDGNIASSNNSILYSSSCGNRKKKAATNRPSNNRFWPASLAAAVSMLSPHPTSSSSLTNPLSSTATMTSTASGGVKSTTLCLDRSSSSSSTTTATGLSIIQPLSPRKRSNTANDSSSDQSSYQPPKLFQHLSLSSASSTNDMLPITTANNNVNTNNNNNNSSNTFNASSHRGTTANFNSGLDFSNHYLSSDLDFKSITNSIIMSNSITSMEDKRNFIELGNNGKSISNDNGNCNNKSGANDNEDNDNDDNEDDISRRKSDEITSSMKLTKDSISKKSLIGKDKSREVNNGSPSIIGSSLFPNPQTQYPYSVPIQSQNQPPSLQHHIHPNQQHHQNQLAHSLYNAASLRYHHHHHHNPLYDHPSIYPQHPASHLSELFQFPPSTYQQHQQHHQFAPRSHNPWDNPDTNPYYTSHNHCTPNTNSLLLLPPTAPPHLQISTPTSNDPSSSPQSSFTNPHHHSFSNFALKAAALTQHSKSSASVNHNDI